MTREEIRRNISDIIQLNHISVELFSDEVDIDEVGYEITGRIFASDEILRLFDRVMANPVD